MPASTQDEGRIRVTCWTSPSQYLDRAKMVVGVHRDRLFVGFRAVLHKSQRELRFLHPAAKPTTTQSISYHLVHVMVIVRVDKRLERSEGWWEEGLSWSVSMNLRPWNWPEQDLTEDQDLLDLIFATWKNTCLRGEHGSTAIRGVGIRWHLLRCQGGFGER